MVGSAISRNPPTSSTLPSFWKEGEISIENSTDIPFLERLGHAFKEDVINIEVQHAVLDQKLASARQALEDIQHRIMFLRQRQGDPRGGDQQVDNVSFGKPTLLMDADDPMEGPSTESQHLKAT